MFAVQCGKKSFAEKQQIFDSFLKQLTVDYTLREGILLETKTLSIHIPSINTYIELTVLPLKRHFY